MIVVLTERVRGPAHGPWRSSTAARLAAPYLAIMGATSMVMGGAASAARCAPISTARNGAAPAPTNDPQDGDDIIVTARRGEASVTPETELREEEIAGYGANTIAQLLAAITPLIDGSATPPVLLVNGKRIGLASGITGFPPEALSRLAILPPRAGAQYGYAADQRIVNLVLKPKFASSDGSIGLTLATAGGRDSETGVASRVVIDGPAYWNAQLQVSRDSMLLRSARSLAPRANPIDLAAHVTGISGGEIDPALSRGAGAAVTIVDVPPTAMTGRPSLADFVAMAEHRVRYSDPDAAEALLPGNRALAFNLGVTHPLGGFSGSLNMNLATNTSRQLLGYAALALVVPAGSPWSPFGTDVVLQPGLADIPIRVARQRTTTLGLSATLSGTVGGWNVTFLANATQGWSSNRFDRSADIAALQARIDAHDPAFDPYAPLTASARVITDRTDSRTRALDAKVLLGKTAVALPAGPATVNLEIGASTMTVTSTGTQAPDLASTDLRRTAITERAALNAPLTRRDHGVGHMLGEVSLTASAALGAVVGSSLQRKGAIGISWSPAATLQVSANYEVAEEPPDAAQLDAPRIETVIHIYDTIREEAAAPVWITGGNPALGRTRRGGLSIAGVWRPFHGRAATLRVGYQQQVASGGATGFPPLTPAVENALADRIERDAGGRLIQIDARPIAVNRDETSRVTTGLTVARSRPGAGDMQFSLTANHVWQLRSVLVIRPDLPALDRLGGDGGQPRHMLSTQFVASRHGLGATLNGRWQSAYRVRDRSVADGQGDYRYADATQIDLGLFLEPGVMLDREHARGWASKARVSINVQNAFGSYQSVKRADGSRIAGYDRFQLDPLGRTIELTFRKRW
jgi:hypothetical protein